MFYYTYLVICTEGTWQGKVYFGQHKTNNLNDGYIASGKKICDYIKKYPNGYYREIIKFYSSEEELNKAEFDLIHPYLGKNYCLNLIEGGHGGAVSDDIRKLLSEKKKGTNNPNYGKPAWNKGLKMNIEFCKHCSDSHKGKHITEKTKKKMSDTHKEKNKSIEYRNKMTECRKGHIVTEETKQKMSASHIGIGKGIHRSEETKKKMSESHKGTIPSNKGKHRVYDDNTKTYHYV